MKNQTKTILVISMLVFSISANDTAPTVETKTCIPKQQVVTRALWKRFLDPFGFVLKNQAPQAIDFNLDEPGNEEEPAPMAEETIREETPKEQFLRALKESDNISCIDSVERMQKIIDSGQLFIDEEIKNRAHSAVIKKMHDRYIDFRLLELIFKNKLVDPNEAIAFDGPTFLHVAMRANNSNNRDAMIHMLLKHGAKKSINVTDCDGNSLLHYKKNPWIIKTFLEEDANPNIENHNGLTPLDILNDPEVSRDHGKDTIENLQRIFKEHGARHGKLYRLGNHLKKVVEFEGDHF